MFNVGRVLAMGVSPGKLNTEYALLPIKSRITFLDNLGKMFTEKGISGCVAEGGVFQGEFAQEINRVFPTSKLYLFDTFSGFDNRDVSYEIEAHSLEFVDKHFQDTNEGLVVSRLPHPEMCVIRKGYFPETTEGLDEAFCFVNLDFDLYKPTLAGLDYFVPRMVKGGVILIHDYFTVGFKGVRAAVNEFCKSEEHQIIPIGDGLSVLVPF